MPAIQEVNKINFGTARMWGISKAGTILPFGQLQDFTVDIKTDIKEAYSEGNYAFATANGHTTIDLSAKHYVRNLTSISNDLGGSAVAVNTTGFVTDEQGVIAAHAYTTGHANLLQLFEVIVGVTINGIMVPVTFQIVNAGAEVAGQSCSVNMTTGVITFAAGEANGEPVKVSYEWTLASNAGSVITVSNTFQNSAPTYKITAVKRDLSPIDGSYGYEAWTFNAVRPAGIKNEWKEGDFTVLDRSMKALADPMGNVLSIVTWNNLSG